MKELIAIQAELRVTKGQKNDFGGYMYRSAEDITEAAKPLCAKQLCALTMEERIEALGKPFVCKEVVEIGDEVRDIETVKGLRFFVVSTATLTNSAGEKVSSTGWAELPEGRKGMDAAQVTGSSVSYARKTALGGLFALDDVKDPDATNAHGKAAPEPVKRAHVPAAKPAPAPKQEPEQSPADKQLAFMQRLGVSPEDIQTAFGTTYDKLSAKDAAFLKAVFKLMLADKELSFEAAFERQSMTEAEAGK